ncbi:chlorophyll synthase ChlG [Hoeflea sp.]|uniref:chlorophyll synthase ChlG n=1 Tax=Hoeflea sp. TaxID=1940281 RepID=UPI003BB0AA45
MSVAQTIPARPRAPTPGAVLALLKPVTWFPPMWAYACGAISAGQITSDRWFAVALGVLLAGPLLCGASQAVNDWFDRHVDAINEPDRVIPSGRMPGRWGLGVAIVSSVLSMVVAAFLGTTVFVAAAIGLALAWAYSAPPFRLKRNGWWGNAACGFSYETLPWITAAAAALGTVPDMGIFTVAILYGLGALGIMTLNDFKSMEGDARMGIASLPVQMGARNAALFAGLVMIAPQAVVVALLAGWSHVFSAVAVGLLALAQAVALPRLVADPKGKAVWYSALGVGLYVTGMMITAFAIRP